jgi:hypothetical protein
MGSVARIADTELVLVEEPEERQMMRSMALEDLDSQVQYPLRREHFVIGPSSDASLRVPNIPRTVLSCEADGEVRLSRGSEDRSWSEGETLVFGNLRLKLVAAPLDWEPTVCDTDPTLESPYEIEARLMGPAGPRVRLVDLARGREATLTAPNRVSLLYFLADAHIQDRLRETNPSSIGWRTNAAASVAVWGRISGASDPRRLKTLIHNVRSDIRQQGLDPWRVEKRRGTLRLRVQGVVLI